MSEKAPPKDVGHDLTLPQWQPPVSATRSVAVGAVKPVSGSRVVEDVGHARTIDAASLPGSIPPGPLPIGGVVGERYVIERHISSGGFGAVYLASDRQIKNHQVALKLLHQPAASEQAREVALRELTLIASVSHPSVVQFKDYGWHEGRLWFAMPYYRGQTLDKRYANDAGPLAMTRAEARPIFERIAMGLAAMHDVGIYHHDIKPENIFLADIAGFEGGLPVLLDLGIASKRGEGPKGLTAEYAAPETAAAVLGGEVKTIAGAADVFSLALVLRNLLEPESTPIMEGELVPHLNRRATEALPPLRRRELRYLAPYFERWLSLDPTERPTPSELADELAILTRPEERREARNRLLRRVIPIVLLAAAAVTFLLMQVREQKTEIIVQKKRLTQEIRQSTELRQQTQNQLQKLEQASEQIGSQSERLQRAITIARGLDQQLEASEQRAEGLTKRVRGLTTERTELTQARDALTRERDQLVQTRDALTRERDGLAQARDALTRERDTLTRERDALTRERDSLSTARDRLEAERNTVLAQRNEALRERDRLQADLRTTNKQLDSQLAENETLSKAHDEARAELKSLRKELKDLEKRHKGLESALEATQTQLRATQTQLKALMKRAAQAPSDAPAAP